MQFDAPRVLPTSRSYTSFFLCMILTNNNIINRIFGGGRGTTCALVFVFFESNRIILLFGCPLLERPKIVLLGTMSEVASQLTMREKEEPTPSGLESKPSPQDEALDCANRRLSNQDHQITRNAPTSTHPRMSDSVRRESERVLAAIRSDSRVPRHTVPELVVSYSQPPPGTQVLMPAIPRRAFEASPFRFLPVHRKSSDPR